jgi:hypothetical protein
LADAFDAVILNKKKLEKEAVIFACIAYGAEMARERYVDLPSEVNA